LILETKGRDADAVDFEEWKEAQEIKAEKAGKAESSIDDENVPVEADVGHTNGKRAKKQN
jgi:hypothetical protein